MVYKFTAVKYSLLSIIATFTVVAMIFVLFVVNDFIKESLAQTIVIVGSFIIMLICVLYLFFFLIFPSIPRKQLAYYKEQFTGYFHETPESIEFNGDNFIVETKDKIYCFDNAGMDYYYVYIFERATSK